MAETDTSNAGASTEAPATQEVTKQESLVPSDAAPEAKAEAKPEWFLREGVKGDGDVPEWYNHKKYKTVEDQAKAQRELEKRLGAFTGAPEKYEFSMPEGVEGEWDSDNPMLQEFQETAKSLNMSQESFDKVLHLYARYESMKSQNDLATEKAAIGDDADKRLASIASWGRANMDEEGFDELRSSCTSAAVVRTIERVIARTRQAPMPKVGDDVHGGITLADVQSEHHKKDAQGNRLYDVDPNHRKKVKQMYEDLYGSQPYQEMR